MLLPEIDFSSIRLHRGGRENAFEELCCQLAGEEYPASERDSFDRKGPGADGGVECFATLSDGTETAWQVKYYWDAPSAIRSLDESLSQALAKHPRMTRFIACLPFDLADSRKSDVTTALDRWNTWKNQRIAEAAGSGRQLEIDRWDAYELRSRLAASNPTAAGRLTYWFSQTQLTNDWFRNSFKRTCVGLGERYSPDSHIDLPIRRVIEATALDPRLFVDLAKFSQAIAEKLATTDRSNVDAVTACDEAIDALDRAAQSNGKPISVVSLREVVNAAREVVLPWYSAQRDVVTSKQPNRSADAISNLLSSISNVARSLAQQHWEYVDDRSLLVVGSAGSGKSHLLADVCDHAIANGRPAVMILGGKLPDAEPWGEILKELGLAGSFQALTFLGALNAAGQASGGRALLMIDALNEKNGQAIWPERLTGLVHDVAQFEWISLVLSCRSTYEYLVIPLELDKKTLPRIEHGGFSQREAHQYLKKRGIRLAEEPNSIEEFETPLFLRICCDALLLEDQSILTSRLGGVTAVFKLYTDAVVKRVTKQINAAPHRRFAERAIRALAQEMADTGCEEVVSSRAYDIIASFFPPAIAAGQDLLFQLQNEGLLTAEPTTDDEAEEEFRFTFQRMSDHAIASTLLASYKSAADVAEAFAGDTALCIAVTGPYKPYTDGLLEALAVQLPERFGIEINDMPALRQLVKVRRAFKEGLLIRDQHSFTPRTWELIREIGGDSLRYEMLIALSTDPGRNHNANSTDEELRALLMPQRDAVWSIYLANNSEHASRLIEWVREADQEAIRPERAALAGIQLCWFLTTSNREVRDTSTKALATLLGYRPDLARILWARFKSIDDAYVVERLVAAIYGGAMQGRWTSSELLCVVQDIHTDLFVSVDFPPNILTRDHARGLVQFAERMGALPDGFDTHLANPPYGSAWPIEYVTEEQVEKYTRSYPGGASHRDEIAASTIFDGNFARYQIDYAIGDWSAATKGTSPLPSTKELADRWLKRFEAAASPEMLAAHKTFVTAVSESADLDYGERREITDKAKAAFRAAVGEDVFAQWSAEASNWRENGMYQRIVNSSQKVAQFNLAWARRWVCKRAHDLGWTEALHGEFDASVNDEHGVERIGKKYQWIALYELCARMADNLQPLPPSKDPSDIARLRNIDPSLLVPRTEDDGWKRFNETCFWVPPGPDFGPVTIDQSLQWLDTNLDMFDGADNIEVTSQADCRQWLVLKGFEIWREKSNGQNRETWRRIACFVVRRIDLSRALSMVECMHFQGEGDIPSARSGGSHSYLGEHPWSWRAADEEPDNEWIRGWRTYGSAKRAVSIRPTTAEYLAEASGYDASIEQNIALNLPAGWLMDGLGMRLTDGATIQYVDRDGIVRFMDPSVAMTGRSAALIDRNAFLAFLKREKLAAIWAISGEKNVYGEGHGGGFGGRWTFTRILHSSGSDIVALGRYQTFDPPSESQLASLKEAEINTSGEDD